MAVEPKNNKVTVFIDDQAYQVSTDNNLLAGVLSQKLNLPYFCWHPSMGSVGACRQCAVTQYQDENDQSGRLVMACTTPVTDGMRISLKDGASQKFREQVIGAMMTNHPHDCPVCTEGGECHLQDMTVMTGHTSRAYQGAKRTFTNQYLGEFVGHEMNRCITCYRCVRFYNDYAGGKDFGVYGSKNQVYFGRQQDGQLDSEFSGNLVEVCPTGVFTNKLFSAHYTRKWDLQSAPSICAHCSVGCNTSVGERYGSVRRVMNRYNQTINGYFLCDRGRFGIGFVNGEQRLRTATGISQQSPEKLTTLDVSRALVHFKGKRFVGVGSSRASYEANYLLKALVGEHYFSLGMSNTQMQISALHHQYLAQYRPPNISEIEQSDFVLIIDEDISQTAPRMALAVRQALRNVSIEKAAQLGVPAWQDSAVRTIGGKCLAPLYLLQSQATKLDDVAEQVLMQSTESTIELLSLLTNFIRTRSPLTALDTDEPSISALINGLINAKKPLIIGGVSSGSPQLFATSLALIDALTAVNNSVNSVMIGQQANTVGGLSLLDEHTLSIDSLLTFINAHENDNEHQAIDGVILLEQELSQFSIEQIKEIKQRDIKVIALDHSRNAVTELADIVLPVAPVTEGDGHFVNYQGQIQAFYQVHPSQLPIQESWRWLGLIAQVLFSSHPLAQTVTSLAQLHQLLVRYDANWPISLSDKTRKIARESHRNSGRTAEMANISVHEAKTTQSTDNYSFSMEGDQTHHGDDMPFTWAPGWNSNQAITQYQQEVAGSLIGQAKPQFIEFKANSALYEKWSGQSKQGVKDKRFTRQILWYQGEWQASLTPEFTLIAQYNQVFVSTEYAEKHGWQQGQWLVISNLPDNGSAAIPAIAQLFIDERLVADLSYGQLNEWGNLSVNKVEFRAATAAEISTYQTQFEEKNASAKTAQREMLERLKQQDQYIPIRLVNGGLDDV